MVKKVSKVIVLLVVFFCSFSFVNVNNVNAMGTPDGNGYAECWYGWADNVTTGIMSRQKNYLMAITVFRNTDGNYDGYAVTGCGELSITSNNIESNKCNLKNYNSIFNSLNSTLLGQKFRGDITNTGTGSWTCPTVYVKTNAGNDVELSLSKKSGFDAVNAKENNSKNNGGPSLNDETINNVNPYTGYTEEGYQKNDPDVSGESFVDRVMNWGKTDDKNWQVGDSCNVINNNQWLSGILSFIFWIVMIGGILVTIILTIMDFIKMITGSDDTGLKKAFQRLIKRVIALVLLMLLPILLNLIVSLVSNNASDSIDGVVKMNSNGDLYCEVVN